MIQSIYLKHILGILLLLMFVLKLAHYAHLLRHTLNNYQMLNYQLPVIDTITGINYINYECAICNMENTTTIEPWKYSLNCSSLPNDTVHFLTNYLKI